MCWPTTPCLRLPEIRWTLLYVLPEWRCYCAAQLTRTAPEPGPHKESTSVLIAETVRLLPTFFRIGHFTQSPCHMIRNDPCAVIWCSKVDATAARGILVRPLVVLDDVSSVWWAGCAISKTEMRAPWTRGPSMQREITRWAMRRAPAPDDVIASRHFIATSMYNHK